MPGMRLVSVLLLLLSAAPAADQKAPTWYVFKIRQLDRVSHSADRSNAFVEGVTIQGRAFKIKLVWPAVFKESFRHSLDLWMKKSKADFAAGVPYVIAGKVLATEPLTIEPDTVVPHAPNFGAPAANIY